MLFRTAIERFTNSYIETALWADGPEDQEAEQTPEFNQHTYQATGEFAARLLGLGIDICNLDDTHLFEKQRMTCG